MGRKVIGLAFKKLNKDAKIPTYGTRESACMDLYAIEDYYLRPGDVKLMRTGLAFEIPNGYEIQIRPRSSAIKNQLLILNTPGTIDADYRGEIMVGVKNIDTKDYAVKKGDRIAQMVPKEVPLALLHEVKEFSTDTERGAGGFGHTGK